MHDKRAIARALIAQIGPVKSRELMERALADKSGLDGFIKLASEQAELERAALADL